MKKLAVNFDPEGWLELPTKIAHGYMIYLAKAVSARRNLASVTDNRDVWAIMPYFKEDANFDEVIYNSEAEGFYTSLIFTDILPANIDFVNIEKIVKFVTLRKEERRRLRTVLQSFSENLQTVSSVEHFRLVIHDYETQVYEAKADFRKSTGFLSEDKRFFLFTVGVPMTLSILSFCNMKGDPFNPTLLAPSVFIGAVAAYMHYNKRKKQVRKDSFASYLVDIDEKLISKKAIPLYHRSFEEFMND
jgi:hypothetical protein